MTDKKLAEKPFKVFGRVRKKAYAYGWTQGRKEGQAAGRKAEQARVLELIKKCCGDCPGTKKSLQHIFCVGCAYKEIEKLIKGESG
jgi:hypothetical protein